MRLCESHAIATRRPVAPPALDRGRPAARRARYRRTCARDRAPGAARAGRRPRRAACVRVGLAVTSRVGSSIRRGDGERARARRRRPGGASGGYASWRVPCLAACAAPRRRPSSRRPRGGTPRDRRSASARSAGTYAAGRDQLVVERRASGPRSRRTRSPASSCSISAPRRLASGTRSRRRTRAAAVRTSRAPVVIVSRTGWRWTTSTCAQRALRLGVEPAQRLDLVAEQLDPHRVRRERRVDVDHAAADRERAGLVDDRRARPAAGDQQRGELVAIDRSRPARSSCRAPRARRAATVRARERLGRA